MTRFRTKKKGETMTTKKKKQIIPRWNPSEMSEKQYKNPMKIETPYDARTYEKTYTIIYRLSCLTVNLFSVKKKKELIKELQNTITKLNELLVELKSENKRK
jgi:hypothetical protein